MVSVGVALLSSMAPFVRQFTLDSPKVSRDERVRFADVHTDHECDIADSLGTEASTLRSQGCSTIPCLVSAFAKRGYIIVAKRSINFANQKACKFDAQIFADSSIVTSEISKTSC
jgi:hypothetical protein